MVEEQRAELITAAIEARERAYAPYSKFMVGAALRCGSGQTYQGCNVENASYGLTCCAERVAIFAARIAGETQIDAIAVASPGGVSPCGACRQVMSEFASDLEIILVDADNPNRIRETTIDALLPERFGPDAIKP